METTDGTISPPMSCGRAESAPADALPAPASEVLWRLVRCSSAAALVTMELPLVLVLVLVVPATVTETLNSRWPDLLPQDCG